MSTDRCAKKLHDACIKMSRYQPHDLLRWLAADVLAGFGVRGTEPPPDDLLPWLREVSGEYARAAIECPFDDVLGIVFQMLGSRGHRSILGQFFTPSSVSRFFAELVVPGPDKQELAPGRLLRVCEPACGSGALLLGFMKTVVGRRGPSALHAWSLTGIDLDNLCAQVCAAQVLSNVFLQRLDMGELVIYRGNALGPIDGLSVVVHATARDLTADLVLPALHPSRIAALRAASGSQGEDGDAAGAGTDSSGEASRGERPARARKAVSSPPTRAEEVDLFAD